MLLIFQLSTPNYREEINKMLTFDELWELLTTQDESNQIEVKQGSEVSKSCWETISAFSNEPGLGGGYLILGITDPSRSLSGQYEITGIENPDQIQRNLLNICNDETFNHRLRPNIILETIEGKTVVIAYIPEAPLNQKPIYITKDKLPKGAYRRIGSADVKCNEDDLQRFYEERQNQSYDTTAITDAILDDLDPQAIKAYRQLRANVKPTASELNYEDQDLLYCLNAITRHPNNPQAYCPTFAGLILFGKAIALRRYFPMHRIDYILIQGTEWISDPDERYLAIEILEPLLLAIPRLSTLVINDLPKTFHLEENSLQRQDIPLIPSKVIREAIVNAVMHRNYRTSNPIQIIRYANRLELHNPGYSLKPINEIDQPGSFMRNTKIAAVLHDLNIAETKGTGGRTMIEAMLEANLTLPCFDSQREKDHFCLILRTHHLLGEEETQWLKQFREFNLSNDEARALAALRQLGKIDNFIYRVANDVDTLIASKKLTRLRDLGLLESNGKGRATYYTLKPEFQLKNQSKTDTFNQDSSTIKAETLSGQFPTPYLDSSTVKPEILSGQFPTPYLDSSTVKPEILSGQFPTPYLDSSTVNPEQLVPELFSTIEKESVEYRLAKIGERTQRKEIKNLILELCQIKPRSSNELASLLNRKRKYLLDEYLKPLINEELLEYTNPEKPNDPHQTYRTIQK
jgi:ATP-dependent DNA helicase RecG